MALILWLPETFKIGETADVRINFKPERVTWSDVHTLTIEPNDRHRILQKELGGDGLIQFVCSDSEVDVGLTEHDGFTVFGKPNPPAIKPKKRKFSYGGRKV